MKFRSNDLGETQLRVPLVCVVYTRESNEGARRTEGSVNVVVWCKDERDEEELPFLGEIWPIKHADRR